MDLAEIAIAALIGLTAGLVGGIAGIGGSIVMLPALALLFGYASESRDEHHLYMAAAMCVNVVVAFSAAIEHRRHNAIDAGVVRALLPGMTLGVVTGVGLSSFFDGSVGKLGLVAFLFIYAAYSVVAVLRGLPEHTEADRRQGTLAPMLIGIGSGLVAGFLGLGGGIILVPMLLLVCRLPTKVAIAASAAVMWFTALVGASLKVFSLTRMDLPAGTDAAAALQLAAVMAVGAQFGAWGGAWAAHKLPVNTLRIVIAGVLAIAATRMLVNTVSIGDSPPQGVLVPPSTEAEPATDAGSPRPVAAVGSPDGAIRGTRREPRSPQPPE